MNIKAFKEGFFSLFGFFSSCETNSSLMSNKQRNKRLSYLEGKIAGGFETDKANLRRDFENIGKDFKKSFEQLKNQLHATTSL